MSTNHQQFLELIGVGGHWLTKTLWPPTEPGGWEVVGEQIAGVSLGLDGISLRGGRRLVPAVVAVCAGMLGQWEVVDGWEVCVEKVGGG